MVHQPLGTYILVDLQQKAQNLLLTHGPRQDQLALFNRAGFTPAGQDHTKAEGVALFTVDQLVTPPKTA